MPAAPAPRRRSRAPKCAAAAASPMPRRAPARRAPVRAARPSGSAAGATFAAKPRDFAQKVNRKMYRGAMRSMLSELVRQDRLLVTDGIALEAPKTQLLASQLKSSWSLEQRADRRRGAGREAVPRGAQPAARRGDRGGALNPLSLVGSRQGADDRRRGEADRGAPAVNREQTHERADGPARHRKDRRTAMQNHNQYTLPRAPRRDQDRRARPPSS